MIEYFILGGCILILIFIIILLKISKKKVKPIDIVALEEKSKIEEVIEALENTKERSLTSYEQEQEENAIISYQELVRAVEIKRGKVNETKETKTEPAIFSTISEIAPKETKTEVNNFSSISEIAPKEINLDNELKENEDISVIKNDIYEEILENVEPEIEVFKDEVDEAIKDALEDFSEPVDITEPLVIDNKKFKSTEFISPIFGKDKDNADFLKELKDFRNNL